MFGLYQLYLHQQPVKLEAGDIIRYDPKDGTVCFVRSDEPLAFSSGTLSGNKHIIGRRIKMIGIAEMIAATHGLGIELHSGADGEIIEFRFIDANAVAQRKEALDDLGPWWAFHPRSSF